ncbi:TonB-dependent receptor domain-containing protein [Halomonas halocynthiae]|uniref:TonB-dependent receptor domain-containing protein n=1 Tax=Halomonas halocynthiae TaxID=176290 RepID=UPI0003F65B37|nr:TonB-dependent receptor [Halomonas halocynthiae]
MTVAFRFSSRSRRVGIVGVSLCLTPVAALAQGLDKPEPVMTQLNPLTVTATRAPRTADETLASVTVLDEATLRRQDPLELTELLRGQPGVNVNTNGSFGKVTGVSIRGAGNSGTLLMIDGIRLRSATTGGAAWQFLDPRMFERVEIVRGSASSLYGADAVGGVVQLFAPEGENGPSPSVTLGGGSFDTRRASASLSGSQGGTRYYVAASHLKTDGIALREGGEKQGYDNTSALVRVSQELGERAKIGVLALRGRGDSDYIGGSNEYVQQVAGVYGEVALSDHWTSRLTLSEARDELKDISAYPSQFDTKTRTARWDNTLDLGAHQLIVGAEHMQDKVESTTVYDKNSRDNTAVFAQGLLDFSPVTVQAALRHDDNEAYGEQLTGSLALGYELDDHHTLRASYGTAFRAPNFNELYYPGFSNPDLDPETSKTYELGVRGQYRVGYWDLSAYRTNVKKLIANEFIDGRYAPYNVNRARLQGVELATGANINDWDLRAALSWSDPEDKETGKRLRREATQSLRLDADYLVGDWELGGSLVAENHRFEDANSTHRLGGYGLVDLRATWHFAPAWFARVNVDNVFDKDYVTAFNTFDDYGYENAGRSVMLSVGFDGR